MKSLYQAHQMYQVNQNNSNVVDIRESFAMTTLLLFATIGTAISLILINSVSYILSMITIRRSLSNAIVNEEYTEIVNKLITDNQNMVCRIVQSKSIDAFNVASKDCYMTSELFNLLNHKERIAVFLHEYAHYKNRHVIRMYGLETTIGIGVTSTVFSIAVLAGLSFPPIIYALIALVLRVTTIPPFLTRQSYKHEYESDDYTKKYNYQNNLISALKKIRKENYNEFKYHTCKKLSSKQCNDIFIDLEEKSKSHPTIKDRIANLMKKPKVLKFFAIMSLARFRKRVTSIELQSHIRKFFRNQNPLVSDREIFK